MVWTVKYKQDTATPGKGTMIAEDSATGLRFERDQVDTGNVAKLDAMIAKAKQAATAAAAAQQYEDSIAAEIAAKLNA